ncbi:MAG: hypothetical protein QUU85_02815, partial [Candidatus Eisenbacteria bacterium]|nr:hypothetical protein [Candidatus Eisenbacteria bacterium]
RCLVGSEMCIRDSDGGGRIQLEWTPADASVAPAGVLTIARDDGNGFVPVARVLATSGSWIDGDSTRLADGKTFAYRLEDTLGTALTGAAGAVPRRSLFDVARFNLLLFLAVFLALLLYFRRLAKRRADLFIRRIPGLDAIEEAVGRATEMGRSVLYVPGIDEANNIQTIYSMVILSNVAKMVAKYETRLIVPICRSFVVPMAEETVRQAYLDAGRPSAFRRDDIRYLSDEQFAFTAATSGIMLREKPAANLFLGSFFAESLMLAETGFSTGAVQIAGTANIHQLPFFVVSCDYTLIGEEFFATSAYLSREPDLVGTLKGTDWMKVLILVLLVVGAVLETAQLSGLSHWLETQ